MQLPSRLQLLVRNLDSYAVIASRTISDPFAFKRELLQFVILPATLLMVLSMLSGYAIGYTANSGTDISTVDPTEIEATLYSADTEQQQLLTGSEVSIDAEQLLLAQHNGSTFTVAGPATFTLADGIIILTEGKALIQTGAEPVTAGVPEQQLKLEPNKTVLIEAEGSIFIVLQGTVELTEQREIQPNEVISFAVENPTVSPFNRGAFSGEGRLKPIYDLLQKHNLLPPSLTDITPPQLTEVSPADGETTNQKVSISGKTSAENSVLINNTSVSLQENGSFTKEFSLKQGENIFTILVRDSSGNKVTKMITVTRVNPRAVDPTPTTNVPVNNQPDPTAQPTQASASCSGNFTQQLLCLINNHRTANGKSTLMLHSSLTQAAQDHSEWMSANNTLSHTGAGGSTPWDRCAAAGTSCDAENIAQNSSATAQNIFNQWKNSSGHNQNMLGSHSRIGIGLSGGYATTVFQ